MRASEILRKLADVIDSAEGAQSSTMGSSPETPNQAELTAVSVDHKDGTEKGGTFVPPLQAKIELLKKSVDVDSVYDQTGPDEDPTGHGDDNEDDPLDQMKKMAGIAIKSEAADDEPLDQ
jgi:hypothetical protein